MTYHVNAIANYFIEKAQSAECRDLTPMKLLKLVYIAHGWSLGLFGKALFNEEVEAWRYGPVIRPLYHELKKYGSSHISRYLEPPAFVRAEAANVKPDSEDAQLLDQVWIGYGSLSGVQLSAITHEKDSPWEKTWDGRGLYGLIIRTSDIEAHYRKLYEEKNTEKPSH